MPLKRFYQSEAGAILLWVIGTLVLASAIAPWLYQSGKFLATTAAHQDLPGILEWLGHACEKSKFGRFYSRALTFSALVLLPILLRRIKRIKGRHGGEKYLLLKISWKNGIFRLLLGVAISSVFLWGLVVLLHAMGALTDVHHPVKLQKLIGFALLPAITASLFEETIFRGIMLGIWLRSARPLSACVGTAAIFAFLHFLDPPSGFEIANPSAPIAGFQLLGSVLFNYTKPVFFVTDFATLFVVGMILAWCRVRTRSLWFPIGLHAGWILAFRCCTQFFDAVPGHFLHPWGIGSSIRSGLLPMLTLGITAVVCHYAMNRFKSADAKF